MSALAADRAAEQQQGSADDGQVAAVTLTGGMQTMSTLALATSGGALFGTPIVMLIAQRAVVNPIDVWTVVGLLTAWVACLAIPGLGMRAAAQSGVGIVLVASPLLLGNASGGPWMPVTLVGFAIVVGAVFALARNAALVIVLVVALVQAAVMRIAPVGAAFADNSLSLFAGPLLTVLAGVGLVLSYDDWRRQAVALDAREEGLERAQVATEQKVRLQRAQEVVERRVHETVLNTLTGIAMGDADAQLTRRRAQRDLEQLELGIQPLDDTLVSRIIDIALTASGAHGISHEIRIADDDTVSASIATALRDATVEALRNVVRHAEARNVRVSATMGERIEIVIADDGIGMSTDVIERFGMTSAIRRGIESIAGTVDIQSHPGAGTIVTLRAPRIADAPAVTQPTEATSLLDGSRGSRFGLFGTNVFLAIFAVPLAFALPASAVVLLASAAFVVGNAVLAWWWTPRLRTWLPLVVMLVGVSALVAPVVFSSGWLTCASGDAAAWLVAGISGGGVLLLLSAHRSLAARLIVVLVIGAATVVLAMAVEQQCRDFTLLSAVVTIIYMAAIAGFLTWIDLRFEAQRRRRLQLWQDIMVSQANLVSRESATEQWNILTAGTRALLEGLATGDKDPRDPIIKAEAETEGSSLRTRLGRGNGEPQALAGLMHRLRYVAKKHGCAVEFTTVTEWSRTDPFPIWLTEATCALAASGVDRIGLVVLHDNESDELLISCPEWEVATFLGFVPQSDEDYIVRVERDGAPGQVLLSIMRGIT